MNFEEFVRRLQREMPGEHCVHDGLGAVQLEAGSAVWPASLLPDEYLDFLRSTNGIDFWVSEGSPSGYFRLLPLHEIGFARERMWGPAQAGLDDEEVPLAHWLALSEHADGAVYIVLNPDQQRYYFMDTCGADLSCPAGGSVEDLFESIWNHWIEPIWDSRQHDV